MKSTRAHPADKSPRKYVRVEKILFAELLVIESQLLCRRGLKESPANKQL